MRKIGLLIVVLAALAAGCASDSEADREFNSLWRQGYGREAAQVLMDHAFRVEGIDRFCAMMVSKNNPASLGMFKSLGLRVVREIPEDDEVDLEITRAEWKLLRAVKGP